jgi:amino acid transporter
VIRLTRDKHISVPVPGKVAATEPGLPAEPPTGTGVHVTSALPRTATWRSAVLVAVGAALLVTVSLGPMAGELGGLSPWVWLATAGVGLLQCFLLAELAARFPLRVGGTPQYVQSAIDAPMLGALSTWSYWFAWTPGIAVNLYLAAGYVQQSVWSGANQLALTAVFGVVLYAINAVGLRPSMRVSAVLSMVAIVPLVLIVTAVALNPSLVHVDRVLPKELPDGGAILSFATLLLVTKWFFVAAWAAYGGEMASTLASEMREGAAAIPRAVLLGGVACLVAFGLTPLLLIAVVGAEGLTKDPLVVFLTASREIFGEGGTAFMGLTLAAGLLLGAQAFIIGSSRTIYQMARDRHLPAVFARVNRRGAPIGSIVWDGAVITMMFVIFGTDVVNVIASANVGYVIVFVLLPLAFLASRRREAPGGTYRVRRGAKALAVLLFAINAVVLVVGGVQWGAEVVLVGAGVVALIIPISAVNRRLSRPPTGLVQHGDSS